MVIGIDASRANQPLKTGVHWYSYYLIEELKKISGPQDHYVLYSPTPLQGDLAQLPANFKSRVLNWPPKFLWTQARLSWEMKFNSPDILFIPAHVIPIIHPQTITTIHDIAFEVFPEAYSKKDRAYLRWSTKFALKAAAKIIVPSEFTKQELVIKYQASADKIAVIPNGYNPKLFRPINDQAASQQVLNKYQLSQPFLFYLGRLEKKKNISMLIEVFKILKNKLPDHQLVLAGQPGFGYSEIKKNIETSGLASDIIQLDRVPAKDLPYLLNVAQLFVFPSLYEGFGLPILEAMACATPIVASAIPTIKEVGREAILTADSQKPTEFAAQILKIIINPDLRKNLISQGLSRVKNYSWASNVQKIHLLLQSYRPNS